MSKGSISAFLENHFLHFNAATLVEAAKAYQNHIQAGGKMMVTLSGAMSTAELGKSLAEMIRQDKVQIIACTGANLEEDLFNLVAHNQYKQLPGYRSLTAEQESALLAQGYNRVTDTCIPEKEAMRKLEGHVLQKWQHADQHGEQFFPHEYFFQLISEGLLKQHYQIDPRDSWVVAACEQGVPLLVPGWEDSTMGNMFAAHCLQGKLKPEIMRSGIGYMTFLAHWYQQHSTGTGMGFFQIGGGIAGDFPICVVPMLHQDMGLSHIPTWRYFCQISDSTTSYGSYSGAVPNEKITWGKLEVDTPKFIIESDATIVAPLVFAYVLGW